ncbi:MAG: exonuclease domain-containing protein [Acidimicrobiia bacterium]
MTSSEEFAPLFDFAQMNKMSGRYAVESGDLVIVDLETTGTYTPPHRICEIGIVRMSGGRVVDEYTTLVNPERDAGAIHIHQLSNHQLRQAPTFPEIANAVLRRLQYATVVAHHAPFEEMFLAAEFTHLGVRLPLLPALCTHQLATVLYPQWQDHRLATACAELHIPLTNAHTALGDARATARLVHQLLGVAHQRGLMVSTDVIPGPLPDLGRAHPPLPRSRFDADLALGR